MNRLAILCFSAVLALPASAQDPSSNYAGELVAQALASHPEVLAITIHASLPKAATNAVAASNVAKPGTPAGPAQLTVLATGQPVLELSADGAQLLSTLPLQDVSGDTIGTVGVALPYSHGADRQALLRRAELVRNELRRKVINATNLADPVPYVAGFQGAPYAQRLVDEVMAAHPELLVVAMHVASLAGDDYPIVASSIGRIGKKADEDDLRVIDSGKPATGAYGAHKTRYGIELPMYDAAGKLIGALSVGYAYKAGDDEQALLRKAQQVEAELGARIPSLARLYGPAI
jgi:hypothetical protein